jgi:hypothetical protein
MVSVVGKSLAHVPWAHESAGMDNITSKLRTTEANI